MRSGANCVPLVNGSRCVDLVEARASLVGGTSFLFSNYNLFEQETNCFELYIRGREIRSVVSTRCHQIWRSSTSPTNMSLLAQSANDDLAQTTDIKVILNVGGQRHETHLSTLNNFTDTRLTWISEQIKLDPRPNREFFFDRHPGLFSHILNYFRTGKLHAPRDICGPMFAEELSYWGIDPKLIEPCCWSYYDEHNELEEKLQGFGALERESVVDSLFDEDDEENQNFDDMSDGYPEADRGHRDQNCSEHVQKVWRRYCKSVWRLLENPYSSTLAWVSKGSS